MNTLVLRLAAPMQAWGVESRFVERDTDRFPSKSGVTGLLCAALGRDRAEPVTDLAGLSMAVRIDHAGLYSRDYHVSGGGKWPGRDYGIARADGSLGKQALPSNRYYLADAEFLVFLHGDCDLLKRCQAALAGPRWPLFLGRKSFPPMPPLCLGASGLRPVELAPKLPWRNRHSRKDAPPEALRLVVESDVPTAMQRFDVPVSFENGNRTFRSRHLQSRWCEGFPVVKSMEDYQSCISRVLS